MFENKKVIITGGSSGVGKILAEQLLAKKANLAIIARDEQKLLSVKKELAEIASSGQVVEVFPCALKAGEEKTLRVSTMKIIQTTPNS